MGPALAGSSRNRLVCHALLATLSLALAIGPAFAGFGHESTGDESDQARRPSRSLMPVAGLPRPAVAKSRPTPETERQPDRAAPPVSWFAPVRPVEIARLRLPLRPPPAFARAALVVAPKTSPPGALA